MEEYQFYHDQKVTIWERTHFAIHADSEEAAILKAAAIDLENMETADDPQIVISANEVLYDTVEELPTAENNGQPTVELFMYDAKFDFISDNVAGAAWDNWWKETDMPTRERILRHRKQSSITQISESEIRKHGDVWWNTLSTEERYRIWRQECIDRP